MPNDQEKRYIKKCQVGNKLQEFCAGRPFQKYIDLTPGKMISQPEWYTPTMDELVQLCREIPNCSKLDDLKLQSRMRITLQGACCDKYLQYLSMKEMWLHFWYKQRWGHTWGEGSDKWA